MADKTMHHVVIGSDTYEIVDSVARVGAEAAFATDTASGAVATFPDGADGVPVKALSVAVEAVQSGSGDPSPTNVRSISGWDTVKVTRCGRNLFDGTLQVGGLAWATGAETATSTARRTGFIPVKPNTSYYEKMLHTDGSGYVIYDANKTRVASRTSTPTAPFTTPATAAYIRVVMTSVSSDSDLRFSLVESDTETDYIEYVGQTYDITLPQTVYGGTLDVSTGVVTVDHAMVDIGTFSWSMTDATNHIFRAAGLTGHEKTNYINYLCSALTPVNTNMSTTVMPDNSCKGNFNVAADLYVKMDAYSDAASLKAALNGVQCVYKLEESAQQTIQLTAEQVTTLLGTNNIYADAGSVSVVYRADTGLYIDKRLNA